MIISLKGKSFIQFLNVLIIWCVIFSTQISLYAFADSPSEIFVKAMDQFADPASPFFTIYQSSNPNIKTLLFTQDPQESPIRVDLIFDQGLLTKFKINDQEPVSLEPETTRLFKIAEAKRNLALAQIQTDNSTFTEPIEAIANKVLNAGLGNSSDSKDRSWISVGMENALTKSLPRSYLYAKNSAAYGTFHILSLLTAGIFIASNILAFTLVVKVGIPFGQALQALPYLLVSDGWILGFQRLSSSYLRRVIRISGQRFLEATQSGDTPALIRDNPDRVKTVQDRLAKVAQVESNCQSILRQLMNGFRWGTPFLRGKH